MNNSQAHDVLSRLNENSTTFPFVVTLDPPQYDLYKAGCIEIHAPDGNYLESIGQHIQNDEINFRDKKMLNQIYLIESLLINTTGTIQLPEKALAGLIDLMNEVQGFCLRYTKK